jgi:hypothetical protein
MRGEDDSTAKYNTEDGNCNECYYNYYNKYGLGPLDFSDSDFDF